MSDLLLTLANPQPGRENALEDWYRERGGPAMLAVAGVQGARAWWAADDLAGPHPYAFLAGFDIAPGDVPAVADHLSATPEPAAIAADGGVREWWFEEQSPQVWTPDAGSGPFDQMVVFSNPREGADAEFNRWYDDVHIPDVFAKIGGFVSAHRLRRAGSPAQPDCPWEYLALYDIPRGRIDHCIQRLAWSRAEREEALAAGRPPQVPVAAVMDEKRLTWFCRCVVPAALARARRS